MFINELKLINSESTYLFHPVFHSHTKLRGGVSMTPPNDKRDKILILTILYSLSGWVYISNTTDRPMNTIGKPAFPAQRGVRKPLAHNGALAITDRALVILQHTQY